MKRILITISLLFMASIAMQAQHVFSGVSGPRFGRIYEDGMADDGTRYIISDMRMIGVYAFSLCKFVPQEGEPWYGIAVESKDYIPRNGLMVIVYGSPDSYQTLVLGQKIADNAMTTKSTIGFRPMLFFGSNNLGGLLMSLSPKTVTSEVSYSVYDLSEEDLILLIDGEINEIRISARTTYSSLNHYLLRTFPEWLAKAKEDVDVRSEQSLNTILEGLE